MALNILASRPMNRWQDDLADLIRTPEELFALLELDADDRRNVWEACRRLSSPSNSSQPFPLRVPRAFAAKMRKGDFDDPLLRQILPLGEELQVTPGYSADPLEEASTNPHPGLIHKYASRVLLVISGSCAIHCRYCFRRHFPYQQNRPGRDQWQPALDYIAATPALNEVIYSGGDPLSAPDRQLAWLTRQISQIPHITRLRIHTRLPVVLPNRIDDTCLAWLADTPLQKVMVLHCNHGNEIDADTSAMVARLRQAGTTVLNQTVLLKGVNDNVDALAALSEKLFDAGILPYYLHLLDKVAGAEHFDTSENEAKTLYHKLLSRLPGFLVPRLVKEIPHAASKLPLI